MIELNTKFLSTGNQRHLYRHGKLVLMIILSMLVTAIPLSMMLILLVVTSASSMIPSAATRVESVTLYLFG